MRTPDTLQQAKNALASIDIHVTLLHSHRVLIGGALDRAERATGAARSEALRELASRVAAARRHGS